MKRKIVILLLALILCIDYIVVSADEPPSPPHRFKGYVINEDGSFFPDDTNISAKVNGVYYYTTVVDGKYGFSDLTEEFQIEGNEGDIVNFYINGNITSQTATWTTGGLNDDFSAYLNLSFDTTPPIISAVSTTSITENQATISWSTNEEASAKVNYGETTSLGNSKLDSSFLTEHAITLLGLKAGTKYYFEVVSYDYSENVATDDNSGDYYSFTTEKSDDSGNDNGGGSSGGGNGGVTPPIAENIQPIADAGGPYYATILSVNFDASKSYDSDGNITSYYWDFGDGLTETTQNVRITHSYVTADNYTVTLAVTDDDDATSSDTTFAFISVDDSDGDGWNDESENYYNTDPNNSSDYPSDIDGDGVPDDYDADDDNDGLTDDKEALIGTDPLDDSDVIRIINDYGLFFLIDTNADGIIDKYYYMGSGLTSDLDTEDDEIFFIDVDNDGVFDYEYSSITGEISLYSEIKPDTEIEDINLTILWIIIVIIVVMLILIRMRRK